MKISNEEKKLLKKLANGDFDGKVGRSTYTSGGSEVWHAIKDGIPERYKEGPGGKFFDNRENVGFSGVLHSLKRWISDEDKLQFLRQFGWLIPDDDANKYSAKFKPKKK